MSADKPSGHVAIAAAESVEMLKSRQIRILTFCACGLLTVAGFQNFSVIPLESLKLIRLSATENVAYASDRTTDIRAWAPTRPNDFSNDLEGTKPILAIPQSGNSLESVGQDWALRQTHLITDGADERFLKDMNQKVKHLFDSDDREPASIEGSEKPNLAEESEPSAFSAIRFSALNRIEMRAPGQTNLSCSVAGSSLFVNLSKPISNRMDVSLQHQTSGSASTIRLHYNW